MKKNSLYKFNLLFCLFILILFRSNSKSQESWSATTLNNAPEHRDWHTAVWTGDEMIIWGGQSNIFVLNTGGRYKLLSNTWTPTSTVNAPEQRMAHSSVWTGNNMIIWGGYNITGNGELRTGGIYDPETDTWTPIDTTNAPSRRHFHTAVWTGSKMIVWGGSCPEEYKTISGGIYDPLTNTWTSTSLINAPDARIWHTAVWTGSKMIVWGGDTLQNNAVNTGAIYDPVQNIWQPTSLVNAPSPRYEHNAIWTGTRMIIWGAGLDNSGGIYDPVSNTWLPTSTINAPQSRYVSTAVWTGNRMVIWGGISTYGNNVLNTGGIYDLINDTWSATTLTNAPLRRYLHTAIWTGDKMILWGGSYEFGPMSSGGIYSNPSIIAINNNDENIPASYSLNQNYPNPFNPITIISFELPISSNVILKVYDAIGREIAELVNERLNADKYEIGFDGENYPSGVYYYSLTARTDNKTYSETKKMLLVK